MPAGALSQWTTSGTRVARSPGMESSSRAAQAQERDFATAQTF
jgi:hypothetical protein